MDKGESPAAKLIDGVLFSNDGTQLICYPPKLPMSKTHGNYIVPQSVTTIYQYAFNFNALSHVVLPNDLKSIDRYAFFDDQNRPTATHVTEITLPASVKYLPQLWNAGSHIQTIVYCEKKPMDTRPTDCLTTCSKLWQKRDSYGKIAPTCVCPRPYRPRASR